MRKLALFLGTIVLFTVVILSCQLDTGTAPDSSIANESPFT